MDGLRVSVLAGEYAKLCEMAEKAEEYRRQLGGTNAALNRARQRARDLEQELDACRGICQQLVEIGYPHNFQLERSDLRDFCHDVTGVIRRCLDLLEGKKILEDNE